MNGPARGGVAVVENRIYWITGSRIICIVSGEDGQNIDDIEINVKTKSPEIMEPDLDQVKNLLIETVEEFLSKRWAPFMFEPGLADRDFAFNNSVSVFEALSWAYPHLPYELKDRVKTFLADEWLSHPPYSRDSVYDPNKGSRREYYANSEYGIRTSYISEPPHPFIGIYSAKLYAERCEEWARVLSSWGDLKQCFEDFANSGWKLSAEKGDLYANCYISSLLAYIDIADKVGDINSSNRAKKIVEENIGSLVKWWKHVSSNLTLKVLKDISEWDEFIGKGDSLFFEIVPHRAKIALFHRMTPEVAKIILSSISDEVDMIWNIFETLCPTWYLSWEERQVHYGENFADLTDFGIDAFKVLAWLKKRA